MDCRIFEAVHRLFRLLCFSIFFAGGAPAQETVFSSTVTLGVGGETSPRSVAGESTGPVFNGNYEFRILKYLAVEAGVSNMLPRTLRFETIPVYLGINPGVTVTYYNSYVCVPCAVVPIPDRTRVTLLPFGPRGIVPLWNGRAELFAGGGGAYALHADGSFYNAWLMQANLGGRIALDAKRRFWVGTSGRFYSNTGPYRQQWLSWTADLGLRFGR